MSHRSAGLANLPHWVHMAAKYWTRAQLSVATLVVGSLTSITLGFSPAPKDVYVFDLIKEHPAPAFGLGGILLILSVLALAVAGQPERTASEHAFGDWPPGAGAAVAPSFHPLPPPVPTSRPLPQPEAKPPARQQVKGARRGLWRIVAVSGMGLLSLVIAGVGVVLAIRSTNQYAQQPVNAIKAYCTDVMHQDYGDAYKLLSTRLQIALSLDEFTHLNQLHDSVDGNVVSCAVAGSAQITSTSAHATIRLVRANLDHTSTSTAYLVREQDNWSMELGAAATHNPAALPLDAGTDIGPLAVAEDFCNAIVKRNLGDAYGFFSPVYTNGYTVDNFLSDMAKLDTDPQPVDLRACHTAYQGYLSDYAALANGGGQLIITSMTLTGQTRPTLNSTEPTQAITYDLSITISKSYDVWRIDDWKGTPE